jgi:SAM-dependent methyltransferase
VGEAAGRALGLGRQCSAFGHRGVAKRLDALASLSELSGERLLDVGCADGTYTRILAEHFDAVDAVDVEPERLEVFAAALASGPLAAKVRVREMSAEWLAFPDATFDVVTAIEVLEHVRDLDRALAEIARVLRPGGRFLLTTPNRLFPFETHGVLIGGGRRLPPPRVPFVTWVPPLHRRVADARAFTAWGLARQVQRHGFAKIGGTYIMPPFDRSPIGRRLRPVVDAVERSPLRVFSMAHALAFRRLEPAPLG